MTQRETLSKGEILATLGLLVLGGRATTKELTKIVKTSEQYIRNLAVGLRRKGIITSLGSSEIRAGIIFGSPFPEVSVKPKQKVHILTMDFSELLEEHPEIIKWTDLTLKIGSPEELEEHLEKVRKEVFKKKSE